MKDHANVTKIIKCSCDNGSQDKKYGKGNRLHYKCGGGWRCFTCKKVKEDTK